MNARKKMFTRSISGISPIAFDSKFAIIVKNDSINSISADILWDLIIQ